MWTATASCQARLVPDFPSNGHQLRDGQATGSIDPVELVQITVHLLRLPVLKQKMNSRLMMADAISENAADIDPLPLAPVVIPVLAEKDPVPATALPCICP